MPSSRLIKITCIRGENCLQNAHFYKQTGPCLKRPSNWRKTLPESRNALNVRISGVRRKGNLPQTLGRHCPRPSARGGGFSNRQLQPSRASFKYPKDPAVPKSSQRLVNLLAHCELLSQTPCAATVSLKVFIRNFLLSKKSSGRSNSGDKVVKHDGVVIHFILCCRSMLVRLGYPSYLPFWSVSTCILEAEIVLGLLYTREGQTPQNGGTLGFRDLGIGCR